MGSPMPHPSDTSSHLPLIPPFQLVTEPMFVFPESHSKFLLAIYFTCGIVIGDLLTTDPYFSVLEAGSSTIKIEQVAGRWQSSPCVLRGHKG